MADRGGESAAVVTRSSSAVIVNGGGRARGGGGGEPAAGRRGWRGRAVAGRVFFNSMRWFSQAGGCSVCEDVEARL